VTLRCGKTFSSIDEEPSSSIDEEPSTGFHAIHPRTCAINCQKLIQ
jgi:hypothetical protein